MGKHNSSWHCHMTSAAPQVKSCFIMYYAAAKPVFLQTHTLYTYVCVAANLPHNVT
jgi:hypothetical protein